MLTAILGRGMGRRRQRFKGPTLSIPDKANRILNGILILMALIVLRFWHLSIVQHDKRVEEAHRPQRRTVIERPERGTIRDRFNIPLATNTLQYNAAVCYAPMREVPKNRKAYVKALSTLLGTELEMDPDRIEDLIYAKAALMPQIPLVIREGISEQQYYRLKMLERRWPGLLAERTATRTYPLGKVGCDIIGYMGAISREEYQTITGEMRQLAAYIAAQDAGEAVELPSYVNSPTEARKRLQMLQERAYAINDLVGKSGIEKQFDAQLRGFRGKTSYYTDAQGHYLQQLPGAREPLPGQRYLLTISAELQEFAEELLAYNEEVREGRSHRYNLKDQSVESLRQPWIKGGAIIALDPNTGDVLAMASYPRFDPNDFIPSGGEEERKAKRLRVHQWLESQGYFAAIWDRLRPLERERLSWSKKSFYIESKELTWDNYLSLVLPPNHPVKPVLARFSSIEHAVRLQNLIERMISLSGASAGWEAFNAIYSEERHTAYVPVGKAAKGKPINRLDEIKTLSAQTLPFFTNLPHNYDKLLLTDLYRLAVDGTRFTPELLEAVGKESLSDYREMSVAYQRLKTSVQGMTQKLFHELQFAAWRKEHLAAYLKHKRVEEEASHRYQRPYTDYVDAIEEEMFKAFWDTHGPALLTAFLTGAKNLPGLNSPELHPYADYYLAWKCELDRGAHSAVEWRTDYDSLRVAVQKLSPALAEQYLQTMRSYTDLQRPLLGRYKPLRSKQAIQTERDLASAFIPAHGFGYGRSQGYRQAVSQGSIFKLITGYEAARQIYLKLKSEGRSVADINPLTVIDDVHMQPGSRSLWNVGYTIDHKPIPQFYKGGRLPRGAHRGIGTVDLVAALERSSNFYFSLLAGDVMEHPNDLRRAALSFSYGRKTGIELPGEITGHLPDDLETDRTSLYALAIGQSSLVATPIQTAVAMATLANGGRCLEPKIVHLTAGKEPSSGEEWLTCQADFSYREELARIGVDFPLFTAAEGLYPQSLINRAPTRVREELPMPPGIRRPLLQAMDLVINGQHGAARAGTIRSFDTLPQFVRDYTALRGQLVGKTGSAEKSETVDLDLSSVNSIYKHIWFASIAFEKGPPGASQEAIWSHPELVVIVYLQYGDFGREGAPLAAQMVHKWREIKTKHK